jgi:hypothetical protein
VTAERSRHVVVPRTDSSGEPIAERTYREEEVAAILHRAARLERDREPGEGALNLREIEDIARESGIDLSLVRQAARDLDDDDRWGIGAAVAGAPLRRTLERVVEGEIGAEHHEQLAQEIRAVRSAVDFLRRSGQLRDLDFILSHIDDLREVFEVRDGEVKMIQSSALVHCRQRTHGSSMS